MKKFSISIWVIAAGGYILSAAVLIAISAAEFRRAQNPAVVATVLTVAAAVLTALIAFAGTTYAKVLEQRAATIKSHRDKKAEFYDKLVGLVMDYMVAEKTNRSVSAKDAMKRGYEFNRGAVIWASDEVIKKRAAFRTLANDDGKQNARLIADLFLAMRADLGHDVGGMSQSYILSVFINDVEKLSVP